MKNPLHPQPLSAVTHQQAEAAARYAEHNYAGPIGDLIARELRDYAQGGTQQPARALAPRLIALMRTTQASDPLPPVPHYAHLPAQYVPGTGLRWRYRTVADGPTALP